MITTHLIFITLVPIGIICLLVFLVILMFLEKRKQKKLLKNYDGRNDKSRRREGTESPNRDTGFAKGKSFTEPKGQQHIPLPQTDTVGKTNNSDGESNQLADLFKRIRES